LKKPKSLAGRTCCCKDLHFFSREKRRVRWWHQFCYGSQQQMSILHRGRSSDSEVIMFHLGLVMVDGFLLTLW
jgi:hypothetical protein